MDSFEDTADGALFNLSYPPTATHAGRFTILSNATVTSAQVGLTGAPFDISANFTDTIFAGFPQGSPDGGISVAVPGLSLRLVNGSAEFAGSALAFGLFTGTSLVSDRVRLSGTTGAYDTPLITGNGVSYGRLIAKFEVPSAGSLAFHILDSAGSVLQSDVQPGGLITANATSVPSIRVRAEMAAPSVGESPQLIRIGAGYVLASNFLAPSYTPGLLVDRLVPMGGGLQLRESYLNWSEAPGNPVITPVASTWHARGILTGSAVNVGSEIWMYVSGIDSSNVIRIGRMVSANGGQTWSIDAQALLNSTASTWDSGYIGIPTVIREANGTFKMWYMGAASPDVFDIGLATSSDGITWTKHPSNPVLTQSSTGWDNYNVGWPVAVKVGSSYTLFFSGRNSGDARKSIGYATSSDGASWTKYTGNPVIRYGDTSAGNYESVASHVAYDFGVYFMYWTCSSGPSAYDTCVSYSTNRQTWVHHNLNPVITHGDGTWDSVTAELAARYVDPATGNSYILFTGRPSTISYSQGRANPHRESGGTVNHYWNLAGEVPHAFVSHSVEGAVPGGTTVQSALAVSTTNGSYAGPEALSNPDTSILTAPRQWMRYSITVSTSSPTASPTLEGARIGYDRHVPAGTFLSAPMPQPYPVANATLVLDATVPAATLLSLFVSNDNGTSWLPASSGSRVDFPSPGVVFRYRVSMVGTSGASPVVRSVAGALGVDSAPNDLSLRGADGSLMAQLSGELLGSTVVDLDPAYFNDRIAPYAGGMPHIPVPFELWVNASTAGAVRVDFIDIRLTFPDLLRVYFAPDSPQVLVEEGESLFLRAVASTTPGVPITYVWDVDGTASPVTADRLQFDALPGTVGNHTVRVDVSNGQFSANHTWTVRVVPKPVFWVAKYYPAVTEVAVPVTLQQFFYVAVANASGIEISIEWTLDGATAGSGAVFVYTAPASPGLHTLSVLVSGGGETGAWTWTVNVTAEPGTVLHHLDVLFTPAGDPELDVGDSEMFRAVVTGPPPQDVEWDWRVDGAAQGSGRNSFTYDATGAGRFVVSVVVFNATALAAHSWTVTVLPPPLPPPPSVAFTQPEEGTTVSAASLRVDGTATAGVTLTVNGARVDLSSGGVFTTTVTLQRGANLITATARDGIGQVTTATLNVTYVVPPVGTESPIEPTTTAPLFVIVLIMAGAVVLLAALWYREYSKGKARDLAETEPGGPRGPP